MIAQQGIMNLEPFILNQEQAMKLSLQFVPWVTVFVRKNALKGPFIAIHMIAIIGIFFVPLTWSNLGLCAIAYVARMFFITAFYHRYFSPRS